MYKSNEIRHEKLSNFGIGQWLLDKGISDNPGEVIDDFQNLAKIKKKFDRPLVNPTLRQRWDAAAGDTGAAMGVLGTTLGTGIKKYGGNVLSETGDSIRKWGIDTVVDDTKRMETGKGLLRVGAVTGAGALGAGGIIAGSALADRMNQSPQVLPEPEEYAAYTKARWRTVDFYI